MGAPRGTTNAEVEHVSLWLHLQRLVERVTALQSEAAVDDCLDIVVELSGADRGLVLLEQEDGTTVVVNARGPSRELTPSERQEVSHTIIRSAMEADGFITWIAADQPATTTSVLSLGISAAMVAPLRVHGVRRGMLYIDFREQRGAIDRMLREFFVAAAALIGGMVDYAASNRVVVDRLAAAQTHVTESRQKPVLEEILLPPG